MKNWESSKGAPARRWAAAPACSRPTPWRRRSEALGRPLPVWPPPPAIAARRDDLAAASGRTVVRLLEAGIRPRHILTREAFENAIAVAMALGGSTNAVLHLLAIANEARVELSIDDFDRVGRRVPHI